MCKLMVMATSNKSYATILKRNQERRLGTKCSKILKHCITTQTEKHKTKSSMNEMEMTHTEWNDTFCFVWFS